MTPIKPVYYVLSLYHLFSYVQCSYLFIYACLKCDAESDLNISTFTCVVAKITKACSTASKETFFFFQLNHLKL